MPREQLSRPRAPRSAASIALATALGLACTTAGTAPIPPSATPPASVERQVTPSATDAAITTADEPHVAINPAPSVAATGRLFVFLPGTGALPSQYRMILRVGAARGYHAIGLNYPNPTAVGVLCAADTDADCFWNVRSEVISGTNTSALLDVSTANSIVNRVQKLVAYLDRQFPTEGWGQYLAGGAIDWSRIVISGHSQGGGHAGVMTKLYAMSRACFFSSPADWRQVANVSATWTIRANITGASQQFGFTHVQDQLVPYAQLRDIWQAMGLSAFGAPVNGDLQLPPYGSSHQISTSATPVIDGAYHGSTVVDVATPKTLQGAAVFEPIWTYLCFP
jgi:hypothetical protein